MSTQPFQGSPENKKNAEKQWQQSRNPKECLNQQSDKWHSRQTRAGNCFTVSDEKTLEFIMTEHRSGSKITFLPDGSIECLANHGRKTIVMGEDRTYVTGASESTYDGDRTELTKGSVHRTTHGNEANAVKGDSALIATNFAVAVEKQIGMAGESGSIKTKGGFNIESTEGAVTMASGTNATVSGKGAVGFKAASVGLNGSNKVGIEGGSEAHFKGGSAEIAMVNGKVYINSGMASSASSVYEGDALDSTSTSGSVA